MNVNFNNVNSGFGAFGKLVNNVLENQKAQTDLAIKTVGIIAQQQAALQQQQTALMAVALLTGVGTRLNVFV
ncbi:MAG: hypothetical protein LBV23_05310 [Deltaproteobacteria bacterium]|nr:hypothetical protein [Deltaproteobacteria bacterium]